MIKIQVIFAFLHFLFFCIFFLGTNSNEAQYQLIWIPWFFIDFPISIAFFILKISSLKLNIIALITHGLLGTIWWYYFAKFWFYVFKKIKKFFNNKRTMAFQILIAILHTIAVLFYFQKTLNDDIEYFVYWFVFMIIDFPFSVLFIFLSYFPINLNYVALSVFGIFGTIWWYLLSGLVFNNIFRRKHSL